MADIRVAISATFTAEPLREPLEFFFGLLGWESKIEFAPFAQIFQTLLDPSSAFAQAEDGVNVLLVRPDDLRGDDAIREVTDAIRSSPHRAPLVIRVCPSPGAVQVEASLRVNLADEHHCRFVTNAEQNGFYPVGEVHDPQGRRIGAIPYTAEYFTALAAAVARAVHQLRLQTVKVIALDCDDTLWSGICGEDGPSGVIVDGPRHALQEFMMAQNAGGRLLTLASKNNEEDVLGTFRAHPEMPLKIEDFAARRLNWEGKAVSLQGLASELQLALDSFVFVDDNPKEAAEVRAELPEVVALSLPPDPLDIPSFLEHVWAFDLPEGLTAEDRIRKQMYQQQSAREQLKRESVNLPDFVRSLELAVEIAPLEEKHLSRAAQLTQRTNQMNFSTRRRTEKEVREFLGAGFGFAVSVSDRFGDYGFAGLILAAETEGALLVDSFLLSCRALGRGVEHAMLRQVGQFALQRGMSEVLPLFERTARNAPAADFLASIGDFSALKLACLTYDPANAQPPQQPALFSGEQTARRPDYQRIAELRGVADLMSAMRSSKMRVTRSETTGGEPRSDLERRLCAVWSELLAVSEIRIDDNFFDLGGHSLLAVQLVSRLHRELGIDLPLETVYTGTLTVAELAHAIESYGRGEVEDAEYASLLAEIENLSDEEAEILLARELNAEPQI